MMLIKSAILFDFRRRTCCSGVSVSSGVGIILENIWQGILRSYQEIGFSIFLGYLESVGKIRKCLLDSISNAMGKKLLTYSLGIPLLFGISLTLPRVGVRIFYGTTQFQFRHKAKNFMRIYREKLFFFSTRAKHKFPRENLVRWKSTLDTLARAPFSDRAEKMIAITWIFQPV